jgi:DNA adenine methylase
MIAAFWQTAAFDTDWLIDAMYDLDISVERWAEMKASTPTRRRDRALRCLFLNRTSFSGVLHDWAGPIGGPGQQSEYTIDCRFPRPTLEYRLRMVGALADMGRIGEITADDYSEVVTRWGRRPGTLQFLDPPFYAKSQRLYRHTFQAVDHRRLADLLRGRKRPWVLSYDNHPDIRNLYSHPGNGEVRVIATYYRGSAGANRRVGELIITNIATPEDIDGRHQG